MQLAIDGSGNFLDISLFDDKNALIYSFFMINRRTHSQQLVNVIDSIFNQCICGVDDINRLYCIVGPGRYTSIRVVIATLKGLFFEKKPRVFWGTSLDISAASVCYDKFRVVGDFFSREAYYCDYEKKNGILLRISEFRKGKAEEINDTDLEIVDSMDSRLFPRTKYVFDIISYFEEVDIHSLNPFY